MPWWVYLIIAIVVVIIIVICIFTGNWKKIKQWLVYAVAQAEKALGSGTGQLKLREVYNSFITKFPIISNFISFNIFSKLVDKALETFENILNTDNAVKDYIVSGATTNTESKEG